MRMLKQDGIELELLLMQIHRAVTILTNAQDTVFTLIDSAAPSDQTVAIELLNGQRQRAADALAGLSLRPSPPSWMPDLKASPSVNTRTSVWLPLISFQIRSEWRGSEERWAGAAVG
ncbi:unnamed protein product [Pleuronectes platessa]|uniref:Uncharacterized protein n=1 Tax=Pleuronectes platessa TaxID=8262 RepID=A0A9N7VI17_PLEPL|nr:unnamed protein product [Pleuronectes platessa]